MIGGGVAGGRHRHRHSTGCCVLPLLVGVSLPLLLPLRAPHPHHLPLRSSREPPRPLAFALRPRWHHWVSGLDEVRPIGEWLLLGCRFQERCCRCFVLLTAAAAELCFGGAVDWRLVCSSSSPALFAELNLRGCGDVGAGPPDVDEVVVGGGRCSARRDPAAVQRHALPCRHQLRRYLPCFPHLQSLNKMPNCSYFVWDLGRKKTHAQHFQSGNTCFFFFLLKFVEKSSVFFINPGFKDCDGKRSTVNKNIK